MAKKLKCWSKFKNFESGGVWDRESGGWVYLYKKGWFRGKEEQYVISHSLTGGSTPSDRQNTGFESRNRALKFAKSYMKEHDKC